MYQGGDIWKDEEIALHLIEWLKTAPEVLKFLYNIIVKMEQSGEPLLNLLSKEFPQYKWIKNKSSYFKKSQYLLKESLISLFSANGS